MRYCKQENEPQSKVRYVHRTQDETDEDTWKTIIDISSLNVAFWVLKVQCYSKQVITGYQKKL